MTVPVASKCFYVLKSSSKPHPKSFSIWEGLWKGRVYVLIRGLQIHCSMVEDWKSRPAGDELSNIMGSNGVSSVLIGFKDGALKLYNEMFDAVAESIDENVKKWKKMK